MTDSDRRTNVPGDGGGEHKAVYKVVADFLQLIGEARKAKAEVQALKREIDGISGTEKVRIKIDADVTAARVGIQTALNGIVARVRADVDTAAIVAKVRAAFRALRVRVTVDADTTRAQAAITAIRTRAISLAVRINETKAVADMRILIRRLSAMGPVRLRVDIDTGGALASLTALMAQLALLEAQLKDVNKLAGTLTIGGGSRGPAAQAGQFLRVFGLIVLIVPLVAALIPIIAALVGGLGQFLSIAIAATGAIGAFAASAVGHLLNVVEAMQNAKANGEALYGSIARLANALTAVRDAYRQFLGDTQEPVYQAIIAALGTVLALLPRLTPVTNAISRVIESLMVEITEGLNSARFSDFIDFLTRAGPQAVSLLTRSLINLFKTLGALGVAFEPFILVFLDGFEKLTEGYDRFARSLSSTDKLSNFMDYALGVAPAVLEFFANFFDATINLGKGLAPIGTLMLNIINGVLAFIASLNPAAIAAFVDAMIGIFVAIKITTSIYALTQALITMRATYAQTVVVLEAFATRFPRLAAAMGIATTGAITLRGAIIALTATTVIGFGIALLVGLLSSLAIANARAASSTNDLTDAQRALGTALSENGGKVDVEGRRRIAQALEDEGLLLAGKNAGISEQELVDAYIGSDSQWERVIAKLKKRQAELIKQQADYYRLGPGFGDKVKDLGQQIDDNQAAIDAAEAERGRSKLEREKYDRITAGTNSIRDNTDATKDNTDSTYESAAAIQEQKDAVDKATDAFDKNADAQQNLADVRRRAAEDNKRAVESQARAEESYTDALKAQKKAHEDVMKARETAARRLEDLRRQVRDAPLNEADARLRRDQDIRALQELRTKQGVTPEEIEAAQRLVERDTNDVADLLQDNATLKEDARKEFKKGIEGSDEVIAAKDAERDANRRVRDSARELAEANADVVRTQADSTRAIKDAEKAALNAQIAMELAAKAVGLTSDELQALKDKQDALERDLVLNLKLNDDDAIGRLDAIAVYIRALELIKLHPEMSVADALKQARKEAADKAENIYVPSEAERDRRTVERDRRAGLADGGSVGDDASGSLGAGAVAAGWAPGAPVAAGAQYGPGHARSDTLPVRLSPGEHVWTAVEVARAGGHAVVEAMRAGAVAGWLGPAVSGLAAARRQGSAPAAVPVQRRVVVPSFAVRDVFARGYAGGGSVAAAAGYSRTTSMTTTTVRGGIEIGSIVVNNPVAETAGDSAYRAVRRLAFEFDDE